MPRPLLLQVLLLACCRAAAGLDRKRGVATWFDASDLDTSLRELQENAKYFASVSLFQFGNSSSTTDQKAAWMKEVTDTLGIETYLLVGGGVDSFYTSTARATTVARFAAEVANGSYTGVDLDYEHLPLHNESITQAYSEFVRVLSSTLHRVGKKLSCCVGSYPTAANGIDVFYDPAVLNETMDVVRVMNYDMYWVGGRGVPSLASRPDCAGAGPTSTQPWARQSMEWWQKRISTEKLVMGLPAYANDYCSLPHWGGANGTQVYRSGPPIVPAEALAGSVETYWQFFEQIYVHRYLAPNGLPRIRYSSDARSTRAHLATADSLGVSQVGFWTWNSADVAMKSALYNWSAAPAPGKAF